LDVRYGIAHSNDADSFNDFDFSGLDNISGNYVFPVTPWATTLQLSASKSDTSVLQAPFTSLNINSELEEYSGTIRQPLYHTLNNEFAVSLTAEKRRAKTFLLGQPFSLSPGAVNGVTSDFALRFAQEFVNRSQVHVLALRSTLNFGLDVFDATNSGMEPDGEFFYWLNRSEAPICCESLTQLGPYEISFPIPLSSCRLNFAGRDVEGDRKSDCAEILSEIRRRALTPKVLL